MRFLKTFELYGYSKNIYIPKEIKYVIEKNFGWNRSIEKLITICSNMGYELSKLKGVNLSKLQTNKSENILVKILINDYFQNNPTIVSEERFNLLEKSNEIFFRGVNQYKWVEEFKYNNSFTGHQNIYQGTWITNNKEYALSFSDNKDSRTLMEIILKENIKICNTEDLKKVQFKLHDELVKIREENLSNENFDKKLHHTINYVINYIVHNGSILSILLGYDAIETKEDINKKVIVVFNKEKIILKK